MSNFKITKEIGQALFMIFETCFIHIKMKAAL